MNLPKLVKMANQIAAFFAGEPDPAARVEAVASHLSRFWERRMRRELIEAVDAGRAPGLHPLVAEAIGKNRTRLLPPAPPPAHGP